MKITFSLGKVSSLVLLMGFLPFSIKAESNNTIPTEKVNSRSMRVMSIYTSEQGRETLVNGNIVRNRLYSVPSQLHLHVISFDGKGNINAQRCSRLIILGPGRSSKGSDLPKVGYAVRLPIPNSQISKLKVEVHSGHSHARCS